MRYLVFATEAEAQAAADAIWATIEPTVAETRAGQPVNPRITQRWATPVQITTGQWVIPSHDGTGEAWGEGWAVIDGEG